MQLLTRDEQRRAEALRLAIQNLGPEAPAMPRENAERRRAYLLACADEFAAYIAGEGRPETREVG